MPIYEYICDETGEVMNVFMKMDEDHPETMTADGHEYRRVFGSIVSNQVAVATHGYPYVSLQAGRNLKDWPDNDSKGRPIIASQAKEKEFMARYNRKRD